MLLDFRAIFKIFGILGATVALLFGLAWCGEHRGVQKQIAKQERVDAKAKGKAVKARRKARAKADKQEIPQDEFFKD